MKKILEFLKGLWFGLRYPIYIIFIGVIAGLIFDNGYVGFFTVFGIILAWGLFNLIRQLLWWITDTGDYEKNDNN